MTSEKSDNGLSLDEDAVKNTVSSLAEFIVRKKASESFRNLPHGSKIYTLATDWEISIIEDSNNVISVTNLGELEDSIRDQNCNNILIKANSLISDEGLLKICTRNAVSKTFFKEV